MVTEFDKTLINLYESSIILDIEISLKKQTLYILYKK